MLLKHKCTTPKANQPYMRSSAADGEHSGPVWAVRWQPAVAVGPRSLVFVSISSDGRLVEWALGKARMMHEVRLSSSYHAHSMAASHTLLLQPQPNPVGMFPGTTNRNDTQTAG